MPYYAISTHTEWAYFPLTKTLWQHLAVPRKQKQEPPPTVAIKNAQDLLKRKGLL